MSYQSYGIQYAKARPFMREVVSEIFRTNQNGTRLIRLIKLSCGHELTGECTAHSRRFCERCYATKTGLIQR